METKKDHRVYTKTPLPNKIVVKKILLRLPKRRYSPLFVFHRRTIVITGTVFGITRAKLKILTTVMRKINFRLSVSKKTHYLLTGAPGRFKNSNKKQAAALKGVPKITEHQFWTYL